MIKFIIYILSKQDMKNTVYDFDLVVVGAGVFGLSTSIFLATHYPHIKFALVEQFKIGHGEGSSGS